MIKKLFRQSNDRSQAGFSKISVRRLIHLEGLHRFWLPQLREPCRCENTGQEIVPVSTCSLPREIVIEHDHSAVSVCHALRHFCKIIVVTLHPTSGAIVHFAKPDLSVGPQVCTKPDVMSAFYTDAKTKSARNFGAKLKF